MWHINRVFESPLDGLNIIVAIMNILQEYKKLVNGFENQITEHVDLHMIEPAIVPLCLIWFLVR